MMESVLLQSREDGVLTLTMNRPDRLNALSQQMLQGLWDALSSAAAAFVEKRAPQFRGR